MMNADLLRRGMNLWPPFLGAGVTVENIAKDFRHAKVRLKHGMMNRNILGVHFGGSLFAMTDPFFYDDGGPKYWQRLYCLGSGSQN